MFNYLSQRAFCTVVENNDTMRLKYFGYIYSKRCYISMDNCVYLCHLAKEGFPTPFCRNCQRVSTRQRRKKPELSICAIEYLWTHFFIHSCSFLRKRRRKKESMDLEYPSSQYSRRPEFMISKLSSIDIGSN